MTCFTAFTRSHNAVILALVLSGTLFAAGHTTFIAPAAFLDNVVVPTGCACIATGDFNGDGKTDVLQVGFPPYINVALGNGDGTFQPPLSTLFSNVEPIVERITVGDFNNDGHPDVLLNLSSPPNQFQIWLGDGTGKFNPGPSFSPGLPAGVAADFNGDGYLDFAAVGESAAQVYLNNGNGSFAAPISSPITGGTSYTNISVNAADLNLDGYPDLVIDYPTSQPIGTRIVSLLGNGHGGFTEPAPTVPPGSDSLFGFVTADFNQDGIPDIADGITHTDTNSVTVRVFFGLGNGGFAQPVSYNVSPEVGNPLFFAAYGLGVVSPKTSRTGVPSGPPNIFIFFAGATLLHELPNTGSGVFAKAVPIVAGSVGGLAGGDLNGDGLTDIVTANSGSILPDGTGAVLLATGESVWVQPASNSDAGPAAMDAFPGQNAAFTDFNHDGIVDALLATGEMLLGVPGQKYAPPIQVGPSGALAVVAADFNNDGCLDAAFASGSSIIVLFGNGDGTFGPPTTYVTSGTITALATADFNNDGLLDIAAANDGSKALTVLLGLGKGMFTQPVDTPVTLTNQGNLTALAVGEFDGEGCPDVAILFTPSQGGSAEALVFLGKADGTFRQTQSLPVPTYAYFEFSILAADVTGDGNIDLVVGHSSSTIQASVAVFPGNGEGVFQTTPLEINVVGGATSLAFTDVNGDGIPDLIGCGMNGDIGVALGAPGGGFSPPQSYYVGPTCYQIYGGRIDPEHWGLSALTGSAGYGHGGEYFVPIVLEEGSTGDTIVPQTLRNLVALILRQV